MTKPTIAPITYDPAGVMIPETGLSWEELTWLGPQLEAARNETLDDLELWKSRGAVPKRKVPLDAGFIDLPERLLANYSQKKEQSSKNSGNTLKWY